MKVGSTTRDRSMPGRSCFSRIHIRLLFSSETVSVWDDSPVYGGKREVQGRNRKTISCRCIYLQAPSSPRHSWPWHKCECSATRLQRDISSVSEVNPQSTKAGGTGSPGPLRELAWGREHTLLCSFLSHCLHTPQDCDGPTWTDINQGDSALQSLRRCGDAQGCYSIAVAWWMHTRNSSQSHSQQMRDCKIYCHTCRKI